MLTSARRTGIDFVGEVVADFFGVTDSKYQYVVDAYNRHVERQLEERAARRRARSAQLAAEAARAEQMEAGGVSMTESAEPSVSVAPAPPAPTCEDERKAAGAAPDL